MPEDGSIETSTINPIRVVLIELNGLLTDIVANTLQSAPDISVVVVTRTEALSVADAIDADVAVLTGAPNGLPAIGRELLTRHPSMHVVTICDDGRDGSLYELRPVERKLGELSAASLLDAVRRVGASRW